MVPIKTTSFFLLIFSILVLFSCQTLSNYELDLGNGKKINYKAQYIVDEDLKIEEGDYSSSEKNEVIFLVIGGAKLTLGQGVMINKETSDSLLNLRQLKDDSTPKDNSIYGINSPIVVIESKASFNGVTISTNSKGAHGIVAINSAQVEIINSAIKTYSGDSKGIQIINKAEITTDEVEITTTGNNSPCLGGDGTITGSRMKLNTEGGNSPLILIEGLQSIVTILPISEGNANNSPIAFIGGAAKLSFNGVSFSCGGKGKAAKPSNENDGKKELVNGGIVIFSEYDENEMVDFEAVDSELTINDSGNKLGASMISVYNILASVDFTSSKMNESSGVMVSTGGHSDVTVTAMNMDVKGDFVAKGNSIIKLKYECSNGNEEFKKEGSVKMECL